MKIKKEISYILRVGPHRYELVYEMLDDNLIFGKGGEEIQDLILWDEFMG